MSIKLKKPKYSKKKKFLLYPYQIGYRKCNVNLDPTSSSGSFTLMAEGSGDLEITVGLRSPSFGDCCGVLLHEIQEAILTDLRLRYCPDQFVRASDSYYFFMNHNEFSEVCARAGEVMSFIIPDMRVAHDFIHKGKQ